MADYYALISNGVVALDIKTGEARLEYYDRARAILADHCRKADPPLSETFIESEGRALENAISKVEAEAMGDDGTPPIVNGVQTQNDYTEDYTRNAALEASWAQIDAKVQMRRERRFAFWGFLIVYAFWIGDLFYERPSFADLYDWLRLGAVIFFLALTILSYFVMRENWSAEQEKRAYIVFAPTMLLSTVLVSIALFFTFKWLAMT
jgi:hypothetical protein